MSIVEIYIKNMFKKTQEDFICEKCGHQVKGSGYTNHCPECLYSKHVDVTPGDRASECHGLMEPIDIYKKGKDWIVIHECQRCGYTSKNRILHEDNFDKVIELEKQINQKKIKG